MSSTSSHLHIYIFTSSHLHIYIFTSSHLHLHICTSTSSHLTSTSSHLHICRSTSSQFSHLHICCGWTQMLSSSKMLMSCPHTFFAFSCFSWLFEISPLTGSPLEAVGFRLSPNAPLVQDTQLPGIGDFQLTSELSPAIPTCRPHGLVSRLWPGGLTKKYCLVLLLFCWTSKDPRLPNPSKVWKAW